MVGNSQYDKVKEITEQLEQGLNDLFESSRYKTWLSTMSRFHQYSLNNTLLIALQKPDASLIAGYNTWQKQFGRTVKKGAKAIRILAPTPYKQKIEREKTDPDTGEILMNADGSYQKEVQEVLRPAFKVVSVFDVSQTEGKELPTIGAEELSGNVEHYDKILQSIKASCPVAISFENIQGGAKGYYHLQENRIVLQKGMSEVQTIKTLIHEMAHQKLHRLDEKGLEMNTQTRNSKEVEAESVAYTICQHLGIDTSDYSFGYIAGWSEGKELTELKDSLDRIRKSASEMIEIIDNSLDKTKQLRSDRYTNVSIVENPKNDMPSIRQKLKEKRQIIRGAEQQSRKTRVEER